MIGTTNAAGSNVTADMLGIVIKGNTTPISASIGQYVIVKNSMINGRPDGLYQATKIIPANTVIDSTYLSSSTVDRGGLNNLQKYQVDKYVQYYHISGNSKTITLTFDGPYPSFLAFGMNSSVIIQAVQITSEGVINQLVGTSTNGLNPAKISDSSCSLSLKPYAALTIVCGKRFTIS